MIDFYKEFEMSLHDMLMAECVHAHEMYDLIGNIKCLNIEEYEEMKELGAKFQALEELLGLDDNETKYNKLWADFAVPFDDTIPF